MSGRGGGNSKFGGREGPKFLYRIKIPKSLSSKILNGGPSSKSGKGGGAAGDAPISVSSCTFTGQ